MDIEKFQDNLDKTFASIKSYIGLEIELFKLIVFEKVAKVLTSVFTLFILIFVLFFTMLFLCLAFVEWYKTAGGTPTHGYLLVALFFFLVGLLVFLLSKRLFLNPMIKGFSNTAFEEDDESAKPDTKEKK